MALEQVKALTRFSLEGVEDGGGARRERLVSFTLGGRDFTATITPDDEEDES